MNTLASANLAKRRISAPPHAPNEFRKGEFVYLPDAPWDALQSGMAVEQGGEWFLELVPSKATESMSRVALSACTHRIGHHILIDDATVRMGKARRGPAIDRRPWLLIRGALQDLLEAADAFRLRLDDLIKQLRSIPGLDGDLIEDTLRMHATMGFAQIDVDKGGTWYALSSLLIDSFRRRRFLASFADDLLANSRRIDDLVRHTGTVGSYREDLVRNLLRKILPSRYEVSTGFVENSPRQLDVLIWDSHRYGALFREGELVVVPAAAVRAIIEVKTTLGTVALDEALEIQFDVMRRDPPAHPVFQGIFAFESTYKNNTSVARRMKTFYNAKGTSGLANSQTYLGQGVHAICVPNRHYVFQEYISTSATSSFPKPHLFGIEPDGKSDIATALFLADLFSFLDIDKAAKSEQLRMFLPVFRGLKAEVLSSVYTAWQPRTARSELAETLKVEGAKKYTAALAAFKAGELDASDLVAALSKPTNASDDAHTG